MTVGQRLLDLIHSALSPARPSGTRFWIRCVKFNNGSQPWSSRDALDGVACWLIWVEGENVQCMLGRIRKSIFKSCPVHSHRANSCAASLGEPRGSGRAGAAAAMHLAACLFAFACWQADRAGRPASARSPPHAPTAARPAPPQVKHPHVSTASVGQRKWRVNRTPVTGARATS